VPTIDDALPVPALVSRVRALELGSLLTSRQNCSASPPQGHRVVGSVSCERFVGRDEHLALLDAGRDAAVIVGEAGVGKSRLVAELERRASERGERVLIGECLELTEGELPYAPVIWALRNEFREGVLGGLPVQDRVELGRLWPELTPPRAGAEVGAEPADKGRLFSLLLELLARLAEKHRIWFVVEDLHWADQATRDFVAFLVRAARGEAIGVVLTVRAEDLHRDRPLRAFVSELTRVRGVRRVELVPFTREELALQVEGITGRRPCARLVDRMFERSEGNAFYTEELLAAGESAELPVSLRELLLLRVDGLSPCARRLVEVATIAGRAIDARLLELVSELAGDGFAEALRETLIHQVLVEVAGGAYAFRHALVREVVYEDLLVGDRRELHAAVARVLAAQPELAATGTSWAGELAHHWYAAGEVAAALEAAVGASVEAERMFAFAESHWHCERALLLWDHVPDPDGVAGIDRGALLGRAAAAALHAHEPARAVELAREAVAELSFVRDAVRLARVQMVLGRSLWLCGDHVAALAAYQDAVRLIPSEPPSAKRASVLAGEALALMLSGRSRDALSVAQDALTLAREVGDKLTEAGLLNTLAYLGPLAGDPVEHAARARAIATELAGVEEVSRSYINGTAALDYEGRTREAAALAEEGIAALRRWGAEEHRYYLVVCLAYYRLRLGEWEEVERLCADAPPEGAVDAAAHHLVGGQLAMGRGDFVTAEMEFALAQPLARAPMWWPPTIAAISTMRLWQGRLDDAADGINDAVEALSSVDYAPWLHDFADAYATAARIAADRAELMRARRSGDVGAAVAMAEDALARLRTLLGSVPEGRQPPRAVAHHALTAAELSRAAGTGDPAAWAEAGEQFRQLGEVYTLAYAQFRQAESLLAHRPADEPTSASLLADAHLITTRLGEKPLRAAIEALAQRSRMHLGEPSDQPADAFAEQGITPREREVLELLAQGASNHQIAQELVISEKTAGVHVSHILSKLGARNRTEAAAIAYRLGVVCQRTPS
jgi:DNA-binding CsgD family transcriptional regulator